jgi:hypothetical protein
MAALPMILMAASTAISIIGAQRQAKDQQEVLEYQAKQQEQKAGQDRASSQRMAIEERRKATLAQSRIQALAGGGGTDATMLGLTGKIAGEGEYNALAALYEGEESALGREGQAAGLKAEGKAARTAANYKSAGTILNAASGFSKYWGDDSPMAPDMSQGARRKIGVY